MYRISSTIKIEAEDSSQALSQIFSAPNVAIQPSLEDTEAKVLLYHDDGRLIAEFSVSIEQH